VTGAFDAVYLERQVKRGGLRRLVRQFYLRRHRRLCSGPTLDFGCGAGDLLAMLPAGSAGFEINPHAVAHARGRGLEVVSFRSDADAPDLPGIEPGRFETLFCGHVLEHLDEPGVTARRLLDAAHARGIARVVFVVPGHRGFQHDATHRQFVTRARLEREGLIAPPGWRLRELSYFPGNARWLGDYLTHHELAIVHERVSA
jgi:SAM-dependent methyltransferase